MDNFKILTLADSEEWIAILKRIPDLEIDFYYHPEYYKLYENYGDGIAYCFVFEFQNDIAVYPFLAKKINDVYPELKIDCFDIQGAYGYNGVVTTSYEPAFIRAFYKAFNGYAQEKKIVAEFTRFHPILKNVTFSKLNMETFFDRYTVGLELKTRIDEIRNEYSKTVKKNLKVTLKNDLKVEIFEKNFQIDIFCEIYKENMDRVASSQYLYFNRRYFEELFSLDNCVQFVVYYNNKPISSSVCFYSNCYFHYHLACSLTDYLKYCPNNILMDSQIEYSVNKGFSYIHLGGGLTSSEEDSLFKFKKGFLADKFEFHIGKKIHNQELYDNIISIWETNNPDKLEKYKNFLLKYRIQ